MRTTLGVVAAAGLGLALAGKLFRRRMLERHGVATSLVKYLRLRFHMRSMDSLLLLADFDRTITTAACGVSCHGVVESCAELSAEYRAATTELFNKYFPLETSTELTREEKIPIMQECMRSAA